MKKILCTMLLFLGLGTFAQEITVDLDNFAEAEITNGLKVIFEKADETSIKITGSSREKVKANVNNGVLRIGLRGYRLLKDDDTVVVIYYTEIDKVTAKRNAEIEFSEELEQTKIAFEVKEGSDLEVSLKVDFLYARVATSATLIASGQAKNMEINILSEGSFQGENLITETADTEVSTNGIANIFVKDYLKATANAGGTILVYGDTKKIDEKTTLGGSVKKLD